MFEFRPYEIWNMIFLWHIHREMCLDLENSRNINTHTHTHTHTQRERDTPHTHTQRERDTHTHTHRERERETHTTHTERERDTHHTHTHTHTQRERETHTTHTHTHTHTERERDTHHTHTHTHTPLQKPNNYTCQVYTGATVSIFGFLFVMISYRFHRKGCLFIIFSTNHVIKHWSQFSHTSYKHSSQSFSFGLFVSDPMKEANISLDSSVRHQTCATTIKIK